MIMATREKVILMVNENWSESSSEDFPIGVFDCEENALDYGVAWLESQDEIETYEEFLTRWNGKPKEYLKKYGLYLSSISYEPPINDLKKAKLCKEINELHNKLATLETALYRLED